MTRTEKEMDANGYYVESSAETLREAQADADEFSRQSGLATWVRKSRAGWDVWAETDEHHEARMLACD